MTLKVPIKRNNRLRTTLGRFVVSSNQRPLCIEIAGFTLDYGARDIVIGIVKHECIHYAFHIMGNPSSDGHPQFESELKKHGAPSTKSTKIGRHFVFICNACGKESESRLKQLNRTPHQYRTSCCKSTLSVIGERIYDGT